MVIQSENIGGAVALRLSDGDHTDPATFADAATLVRVFVNALGLGSKNAILLGSVFAEYLSEDISGVYGWQAGQDYWPAPSIEIWQGLELGREGTRALFFPKIPPGWQEVDIDQAQANDSIAFFVNYTGQSDLDAFINNLPVGDDPWAHIVEVTDSIIAADADGIGLVTYISAEKEKRIRQDYR